MLNGDALAPSAPLYPQSQSLLAIEPKRPLDVNLLAFAPWQNMDESITEKRSNAGPRRSRRGPAASIPVIGTPIMMPNDARLPDQSISPSVRNCAFDRGVLRSVLSGLVSCWRRASDMSMLPSGCAALRASCH